MIIKEAVAVASAAINPECQQGKHDNCDGIAVDPDSGDLTSCQCDCHQEAPLT